MDIDWGRDHEVPPERPHQNRRYRNNSSVYGQIRQDLQQNQQQSRHHHHHHHHRSPTSISSEESRSNGRDSVSSAGQQRGNARNTNQHGGTPIGERQRPNIALPPSLVENQPSSQYNHNYENYYNNYQEHTNCSSDPQITLSTSQHYTHVTHGSYEDSHQQHNEDSYDSSDSSDSAEDAFAVVNPFGSRRASSHQESNRGSIRSSHRGSNRDSGSTRPRPTPVPEELGLCSCIWRLFHRLLHCALWAFVLMIIIVGVVLIVTLPPLKCPTHCTSGGCTMNVIGLYKTSSDSLVCTCLSQDDVVADHCTYKSWTPQARQQFYAALILLIPTIVILCCGCCIHCATSERVRRARKRLVRPSASPAPPTTVAPPPAASEADDDEEAQLNDEHEEDHSAHEEEEPEELDIPTHHIPAEITVRSNRSQVPLASLSKDSVPTTEVDIRLVAQAINQDFLDENCFSIGSNPAYVEAVVVGTFGADEEIDEMAEYREANEEAERLQRLQQQQ